MTTPKAVPAMCRRALLALAVAAIGLATTAEEASEAAEAAPPGRFTMTIDRAARDPKEVEEKNRRGVNEKFGGFNKVIFEGRKEETLDLGRELKWEYATTFQPRTFQPECQADLSISYAQMYDKVRIDTTIRHDGCPASSGDYRIRMRTRAEDGEINTHEFHESWSREVAETIEIRKDYPMGADPDLVWARVQTSHASNCRCTPIATTPDLAEPVASPTTTTP